MQAARVLTGELSAQLIRLGLDGFNIKLELLLSWLCWLKQPLLKV